METFSVTPYEKIEMYVIHFSRKPEYSLWTWSFVCSIILKALYGRLYEVGFRSIESLGHLRPLIQLTWRFIFISCQRGFELLRRNRVWIYSWIVSFKFIYSEKASKFCEISNALQIWLALHGTNLQWRFPKILWPSQNIWSLPCSPNPITNSKNYKSQSLRIFSPIRTSITSIFLFICTFFLIKKTNLNGKEI